MGKASIRPLARPVHMQYHYVPVTSMQ